jgi:hypothetical protein
MKLLKPAMIAGVVGALALSSVTASQARVRPWVAGAAGFAAGAAIGSAAASNGYYYNNGYGYNDDSYAYAYDRPATAYTGDPAYAGYNAYGYAPGYGYRTGPYWQERRLEGRDY